ncbi:MAG: hypothetical protein OCD01_01625 [Fibrobacterales bacterium]
MKYLLTIAALGLIACTSTKPNTEANVTTKPSPVAIVEESESQERHLAMTPSILGKSGMKLSLNKGESMRSNEILLTVTLPDKCEDIESNISFDVDGTYYFFPAVESASECTVDQLTSQTKTIGTYLVDIRFVETVLRARQVHVILGTAMGTFTKGGISTAQYGFKEFLTKVNTL